MAEVREVPPDSEDAGLARSLQVRILRPDGPLPTDREPGPDWRTLAAWRARQIVGAVTICSEPWPRPDLIGLPAPHGRLRALAVDPRRRGHGVGSQLVDAAGRWAQLHGMTGLWAEVREEAVPLYLRLGWAAVGGLWHKPGVGPHRYCVMQLAGASDQGRDR